MTQPLTIDDKDNILVMDLDIASLINPISPDFPSGGDLRYTEVVDLIKEARRADDQLDQGEWRTEIKTSDWRQVARLCRQALAGQSKDLQIAAWLVEAWVHIHGFAGLGAGIDLITQLLMLFWPTLYPQVEDGDLDYRVGPLTLLNEKLPHVVFQVPLCDPDLSAGYNYYHWEESRLVGGGQNLDKEQKKRRDALLTEGKVSAEEFTAASNASPLTYYRNLSRQLAEAHQTLISLDEAVTDLFAPDPPGFNQLMDAVERCARVADRIFKAKCKSEVMPVEEDENAIEAHSEVFPIKDVSEDGVMADTPVLDQWSGLHERAIGDISPEEKDLWRQSSQKLEQGRLKEAMDQLLSAAALAPSIREKHRYLLLLAKLCLKANRVDLARPIAEELYQLIETLNLEQWEHPTWIAEVVETLYRCLTTSEEGGDRVITLFQKLCLLNVTKAAAYRLA